jgi:Domain of unknown function (DUF5666)
VRGLAAAFVFALAASFGAAPAWACDPGGIGGTGIDPGGIGGTGQRAEAEVGVLGIITGFASICVNGIEVHFDPATPVSLNGEPASSAALGLGQLVAVRAVGSGNQARAREIDIVDAAVGALTGIETPGELLQVQGRRVRVGTSTVFGGGLSRGQLAAAQIGDAMRVSGLRDADGTIVATRVEPAAGARPSTADPVDPGLARFLVQGYIAAVQPQALRVGDTTFGIAPELSSQLAQGQLVRVAGRNERGDRIVERADVLTGPFDLRPERTLRVEPRPRSSDERRSGREGGEDRSGRSGGEVDRSGRGGGEVERVDRSGRSGPERVERPERVDRSGPGSRPERVERPDRSGSNSGRN